MYKLKDNPVLYPYQIQILKEFFAASVGKQFFLTGGTALAAFYLGHRYSKDLDFFSIEKYDSLQLAKIVDQIVKTTSSKLRTEVKTEQYWEVYLENTKEQWTQRIDFVREQPVLFGERKVVEGLIIDSLENIASNKILTIYGRLEPKDYLDLYFIFRETNIKFFELFDKTKRKDAGLHEFYFGNIIANVKDLKHFPETIKPFDKKDLKEYYLKLSEELLKKIKPKD